LPFLKKRSKIIEIVAARDIVFALAQSGVCAAFSRGGYYNWLLVCHIYFILYLNMLLRDLCCLFSLIATVQRPMKGYAS